MMNAIAELISKDWANALGWTLLHSIWQGLIILLLVAIFLRWIPTLHSATRYAIACSGLVLFVVATLTTFIYLHHGTTNLAHERSGIPGVNYISNPVIQLPSSTWALDVSSAIQKIMPLVLMGWMAGFLFFTLRLSSGVFYSYRLRSESTPIDNEWYAYIQNISQKLGINRVISLAESAAINAPIVIGYFNPLIVIPVGMLTGLTPEQLETIFLHELAHIKRHDYLINFIQSVIETVFFFNPFVWKLSDIIRREREYCCDDVVVRQHGGVKAYAYALTQLAERRLAPHTFALSLAEDKNQLLNRIRRIMENSVKNCSGKSRLMIPAILLFAGLLCISWLGIHQEKDTKTDSLLTEQDTVIQKNKKGARYSRKSIITIDENGQPHEEIVEEFEGDEALRPLIEPIPPIPDISVVPAVPDLQVDPVIPDLTLPTPPDSLPPVPYGFRYQEQWDDFSKHLNEDLQENLEDLLTENDHDRLKMLEEFEQKFGWDFSTPFHFNLPPGIFESLKDFPDKEAFKNLEEELQRFGDIHREHFRDFENDFDGFRFEKALREQLIDDGYLAGDEAIQSLEWNGNVFKINGKKIKEADAKKYREKFFDYNHHPYRLE